MSAPICPCCGYDFEQDRPIERGPFKMHPYCNPIVNGRSVRLTPSERTVLWSLLKANGAVVTKEAILERTDTGASSKIIDVWICRIRAKLRSAGFDHVETVWGRGHRWAWPVDLAEAA